MRVMVLIKATPESEAGVPPIATSTIWPAQCAADTLAPEDSTKEAVTLVQREGDMAEVARSAG